MARITVEDCLSNINNRFELVLIASKRARDLMRKGKDPLVPIENDKATVLALREIAAGAIDARILDNIDPVIQPELLTPVAASQNSDHAVAGSLVNNKFCFPEVLLKQVNNQEKSAPVMMQPVLLKDFSLEKKKVATDDSSLKLQTSDTEVTTVEDTLLVEYDNHSESAGENHIV